MRLDDYDPNINVEDQRGSGGGGGGWYGGGTSARSGYLYSGAGGSGYVRKGVAGSTTRNDGPAPAGKPPAGVAVGGSGGVTTTASIQNGGDGAVVLALLPAVEPLQVGDVRPVPYTGFAQKMTVGATGALKVKLWGAGGAGGFNTTPQAGVVGGAGVRADLDRP